ncbi:MAG: CDP-diacylglycerol--serine O-phosphatidyltransferase [Bacteroidales bacterium]|nr:CDP-diacylglycerol--serine O-phosphatidyltransferase [Bacteroidales bacterium]MBD5273574.1 CDP-diacylglycerol--serine O-phosphatidyltransferase [Bacteroides sp.]MDE6257561.1 CDP-diacylglycerol--serine O-phosphatidyltransferase [Muribaculaceae bacterium]
MNTIKKNIPNSITCLNILAGVLSIICTIKGDSPLWGLKGYEWGYIFIGIAAVADFLDGFCARLLHAYSDMGKELDSLCDLVSFGVAPALAVYTCLESNGDSWVKWLALLIAVAGALRLAKFNVDTRQTENFIGLPIPANAIFWIGYTSLVYAGSTLLSSDWMFAIAVIIESWLMISPVKLFSLKFKTWGWKGNEFRWLLIATAIALVFCMGVSGLMWLIIVYVCYGLFDNARK